MRENHHDHNPTDSHHHHGGRPTAGKNLLGPATDELAECPVMKGSTVVKTDAEAAGLYRDYQGTRYWFCCAACEPLFDANPAQYATA